MRTTRRIGAGTPLGPRAPHRGLVRLLSSAALLLAGAGGSSCRELVSAPESPRPSVTVDDPAEGQAITFDAPFVVRGRAQAPAEGTLTRVELVLGDRGVARQVELRGPEASFEAALTIPGHGHLGPDRLPVELVVIPYALADGAERRGSREIVPLTLVDRSRPSLSYRIEPAGLPPIPGFDHVLPPGTPFAISVLAEDDVGGVTRIEVEAPAFVGGTRGRNTPPTRRAALELTYAPPESADLVLVLRGADAAAQPNTTERRIVVRIGDGGEDGVAPALSFITPEHAECGEDVSLGALAVDDASGIGRVTIRSGATERTTFGPAPDHPLTLLANATITTPRGAPSGATIPLEADAEDTAGNRAATVRTTLPIADGRPPFLAAVLAADPSIRPGGVWSAVLQGRERCGLITEAQVVFDDGAGTRETTTAPVLTAELDELLSFAVPGGLCALATITASVALRDDSGLTSAATLLRAPGRDVYPPSAALVFLAPPGGSAPGDRLELSARADDAETPIRSLSVAASPLDLALPPVLLASTATFTAALCAERGERDVGVQLDIPEGVRFLARDGAIRVVVEARDAAGNLDTEELEIPIIDATPPELSFVSPAGGTIVAPGDALEVTARAFDRNHTIDRIVLTISGPAGLGALGTRSATITGGLAEVLAEATVVVDPAAPPGAPITLSARAWDSGATAPPVDALIGWTTCGAVRVTGVTPAIGPRAGGGRIHLFGEGLAAGVSVSLGGLVLGDVQVETATSAFAIIPAGDHAPGPRDLQVTSTCGGGSVGSLGAAYRFVDRPRVFLPRPGPASTAAAGEEVAVSAAGRGDDVDLASLEVTLAGGTGVSALGPAASLTLDATILVPGTATSATFLAAAEDVLGQRSLTRVTVPVGPAVLQAVELSAERPWVVLGETVGLQVLGAFSDQATRDVSPSCSVRGTPAIAELSPGALVATSTGTIVLSAECDGVTAELALEILDAAVAFAHGAVLLASGSGASPAYVELLAFEGGRVEDVTAAASFTSDDPSIVSVTGSLLSAGVPGETTVRASVTSSTGATRSASLQVRVGPTLELGVGERGWVPSGQRFEGGVVAGELFLLRPPIPQLGFTLAVEPGGELTVTETGRVSGRGGAGGPTARGGRGAAGAGGGGAAAARGGAPGGFGDPSGESTADDLGSTPGGAGGGTQAGGSGAPAFTLGAAGAGGAGGGRGGDGGRAPGEPPAAGGEVGGGGAGGGGGGRQGGGGGGGGGAHLTLLAPGASLRLDGIIDVGGGPGAARARLGTPGGGGGGGVLVVSASSLEGTGRVVARGGPGGAVSGDAPLGSGGGGGGGVVQLVVGAGLELWLDVEGGGTSQATTGAIAGEPGRRGRVER